MVLPRHPRPAGFVALLTLGMAVAGPAFARTGLQSEHYVIPPQLAQVGSADTANMSAPSFDHGDNGSERTTDMGAAGHDLGGHGHAGGHGRR